MQALVAKVAKKAWLWPCLPALPGRIFLVSLIFLFGRAPDARVKLKHHGSKQTKQIVEISHVVL